LHNDPAKKITKKFIFDNSNYTIGLEIKIRNLSASPLKIQIPLILGGLDFSSRDLQARYQDALLVTKEKAWHSNARKDLSLPELKFAGLRERYFCAIIQPLTSDYTGQVRKITPTESAISIHSPELNIGPQEEITQLYRIYLGPQELQRINRIQPEWSAIIYYGIFDLIAQVLMQFLGFLYRLAHNWGLAIIFLSLAIYFLLYPLSLKQMRSMKEMQILQPQIEALRITYKDNPQKLNKEIMELYREHKVNPLGGCLPLLLQMPIFFALYQVLMRSVVLRGAKFLWIKDLSGPDKLFTLSGSLPVIGNEINILPIIMAIGMFFQQKISAASSTGTSAEQQKIMLILFPLMFGFIFYHMPAGLVLYWFVNSGLMLASQLRMNRQK
jgi:YidC/Oxa1 family membrane protein insertase